MERVKTCGKEDEEVELMTDWSRRVIELDRSLWLRIIRLHSVRRTIETVVLMSILVYGAWQV